MEDNIDDSSQMYPKVQRQKQSHLRLQTSRFKWSNQDVQPNNLKQAIATGKILVANLTLTKDGRLIDKTEEKLQNKKLGEAPNKPSYNNLSSEEKTGVLEGKALELIGKTDFKEPCDYFEIADSNIDSLEVDIYMGYGTLLDISINFKKRVASVCVNEQDDEGSLTGDYICNIALNNLDIETFNSAQKIVDKVVTLNNITDIKVSIDNNLVLHSNIEKITYPISIEKYVACLDKYIEFRENLDAKALEENGKIFSSIKDALNLEFISYKGTTACASAYEFTLFNNRNTDYRCILSIDNYTDDILFRINTTDNKDIFIITDTKSLDYIKELVKKAFETDSEKYSRLTIIKTEHTYKVGDNLIHKIDTNKAVKDKFGKIIFSKTFDSMYN